MPDCHDCGIDTLPSPPRNRQEAQWYMVTDTVWSNAQMTAGYLCIDCLENRIGRLLTAADFKNLPVNYPGIFDDTPRLRAIKGLVAIQNWKENTP